MFALYSKTWALFRRGIIAFSIIAIFLGVVGHFWTDSSGGVGTAIAQLILVFWVHRYFLRGEFVFGKDQIFARNEALDKKGIFKFIMIAMVLIIGPMAAAMIVAFSYMQPDSPEDMFLGILVIVFTPVYWVAMGLFGTLLPAIADRDARYTLRAGMKKFPVMMLRLFLGPGLSLIVTLGVVSGVSVLLLGVMQIENVALQVILSIIASLVGIFNAALGAAVLCSVYRMVVPAAEPTAAE